MRQCNSFNKEGCQRFKSFFFFLFFRTNWDDDSGTPLRKSSWDYPTPKNFALKDGSQSDWSYKHEERSHRMYDDTPRPTPAHKYNVWAKERRRTGATPLPGKGF